MIRSPISMSDWIPGGFGDEPAQGAFTGFGTFGTDPASGGIVDSRGAFNPAFNGRTQHPLFEAETDAFTRALPGLARKARAGDANAAFAYQSAYGSVAARKRLYDLAWSTGLNDRNAVDLMNHAMTSVTVDDFGAGTDQFRTEKVRYLAREAQRRRSNVTDLLTRERSLDDAFSTSFMSALSSAPGVGRSGGVRDVFGSSRGMVAATGLRFKTALSDWQARNGLRSDAMSEAIMSRAGDYYAKCMSNPGLRPLAGDFGLIVDSAAQDVGAKAGVHGRNRFDDYTITVNSLDDMVTATGSVEGDRLLGDGPGKAVSAVKNAYVRFIGSNVAAGRKALEGDDTSTAQLRYDIIDNFTRISPNARSESGFYGADGGTGADSMIGRFADRVIGDMKKGRVNLSDLAGMYYDNPANPTAAFKPSAALQFRDEIGRIGEQLVTEYVGNRSTFRNTVTSKGFMDRGTEPEYNREFIAERVSDAVSRWAADPKYAEFAKANPEFMKSVTGMMIDYIDNANNVSDPRNLWGGESEEYRTGMRDRVNAMYMAMELARRGVDLKGWTPVTKGEDEAVRGRGTGNLRSTYGGLLDAANRWLKEHPTSGRDDEGFHNWHFINSVAKGLGYKLQSGTDAKPDTPEGRRAADYARLFDAYAGSGLEAARKSADAALAVKRQEDLARSYAVPQFGSEGQNAALQVMARDMFADILDPYLSKRAKEYALTRLGSDGFRYLDGNVRSLFADRYSPGVLTLMRQVMREHPELPMSAWASDNLMYRRLDELTGPLFSEASRMSEALGQAKLDDLKERGEIEVQKSVLTAKRKEEAGL